MHCQNGSDILKRKEVEARSAKHWGRFVCFGEQMLGGKNNFKGAAAALMVSTWNIVLPAT